MLKIGDRIRIISLPKDKEAFLRTDVRKAYRKIIARKRSVRICLIDDNGTPWFTVRIWNRKGFWQKHVLAVYNDDKNWRKT